MNISSIMEESDVSVANSKFSESQIAVAASGALVEVDVGATPESQRLEPGACASSFYSLSHRQSTVRRSLNFGSRSGAFAHPHQSQTMTSGTADEQTVKGASASDAHSCSISTCQLNMNGNALNLNRPRPSRSAPSSPNRESPPPPDHLNQSQSSSKINISILADQNPVNQYQPLLSTTDLSALMHSVKDSIQKGKLKMSEFGTLLKNHSALENCAKNQSQSFAIDFAAESDSDAHKREIEFLSSLPNEQFIQLFEAETLKRQHLESKVVKLELRNAHLEQRLTVGESLVAAQSKVLNQTSECIADLLESMGQLDVDRTDLLNRVSTECVRLKESLSLSTAYEQTMSNRIDQLQKEQISLNKQLEHLQRYNQQQRFQLDTVNLQLETCNKEKQDLLSAQCKHKQLETEWKVKECEYTKELLAFERLGQQQQTEIEHLQAQYVHQQSTMERMQKEHETSIKAVRSDLLRKHQQQMEESEAHHKQQRQFELAQQKHKANVVVKELQQKCARAEEQCLQTEHELQTLKDGLYEHQQLMCQEIQMKLAAKYSELLMEFNGTPAANSQAVNGSNSSNMLSALNTHQNQVGFDPAANNTLPSTIPHQQHPDHSLAAEGNDLSALSLADDFLKDLLHQTDRLQTPLTNQHSASNTAIMTLPATNARNNTQNRNPAVVTFNSEQPTNGVETLSNEQRRAQLQTYLKQFLNKNGSSSTHPTDPRNMK